MLLENLASILQAKLMFKTDLVHLVEVNYVEQNKKNTEIDIFK